MRVRRRARLRLLVHWTKAFGGDGGGVGRGAPVDACEVGGCRVTVGDGADGD